MTSVSPPIDEPRSQRATRQFDQHPCGQRANGRYTKTYLTYLSLFHLTISSSWSERHEQVIKTCLKSEEVFRTYLTENPSNVRRAYMVFRALVQLFSELVDDREKLEEKVKELDHAKSRMKGAFTYVEDQLNTLRAAQPAPMSPAPASASASAPAPASASAPAPASPVAPMATHPIQYPTLPMQSPTTAPVSVAPVPAHVASSAPASPLPTPSKYDVPSASDRSHVARVIKTPDSERFYADKGKDEITYEDWHLQMLSKMLINASTMPTEAAKRGYVQSRTGGHALAQLKPRLRPTSTNPFVTADEMFKVLTAAFGNANQKQEDRAAYRSLNQGTRDFSSFWAEFQRLVQDLDLSEETKISDLIQKSHHTIQHKLATRDEEPTNLVQLARRCQRIEQVLKELNRSKLVQDRIAKRATRRNNGYNGKQAIVNPPATSAAPPASPNSTTSRMGQISQPRAQLAAPSNTNTNSATLATPRLTSEEMDRLRKFNRCFNCKEKGHVSRNCTKPSKPYSAVSAALQEVTIVEENSESESEKA